MQSSIHYCMGVFLTNQNKVASETITSHPVSKMLGAQNETLDLSTAKINCEYFIVGYKTHVAFNIKRRLLELGLTAGTKVTLHQKSFLNEVLLIELNGYMLSLRSSVAKHVLIKQKTASEGI